MIWLHTKDGECDKNCPLRRDLMYVRGFQLAGKWWELMWAQIGKPVRRSVGQPETATANLSVRVGEGHAARLRGSRARGGKGGNRPTITSKWNISWGRCVRYMVCR